MRYLRFNPTHGQSAPEFASSRDLGGDTRYRRSGNGRRLVSAALALTTATVLLGAGDHAVRAASGGSYTLDPTVVAGGGATLSGGRFRLSGTVGQTVTATLSASGFSLHDGFWPVQASTTDTIFANGFEL